MSYAVELTGDAQEYLRTPTCTLEMYKFLHLELKRLATNPAYLAEYNTMGAGVFKTYAHFGGLHQHLFEVYFTRFDKEQRLVVDQIVISELPGPH